MSGVPLSALDARQQKLMENARAALQRGDFEYACDATTHVLRSVPRCLAARQLQRMARLRRREHQGNGVLAKMASGVSSAPFLFGAAKKDPTEMLELAEGVLDKHPNNLGALKLLAAAAEKMGWTETVTFALEAVREIAPENRANVLALGEAWLAAGKPSEALSVVDELLRDDPADSAAQDLMRKASVAEAMKQGEWSESGNKGKRAPAAAGHLRAG